MNILTVDELLEIDRNRADEMEAELSGVEVWELQMQRKGATAAQIEAKRAERLSKIGQILRL